MAYFMFNISLNLREQSLFYKHNTDMKVTLKERQKLQVLERLNDLAIGKFTISGFKNIL
jgi:hypothetical protein